MARPDTPAQGPGQEDAYEAPRYWSGLLGRDLTTRGVGYPSLPIAFNEATYRAMVRSVHRVLDPVLPRDRSALRVLDVGAGSGYWIEFWRTQGVTDITGVDLTSEAVGELSRRHPDITFAQHDVADPLPESLGTFDVISVMSVLLHLTDEERLVRAIGNLRRALKPGGRIVMIEPIVVHRWWNDPGDDPSANSRARPLSFWRARFASEGLELREMVPVTCLLASVVDTRWAWSDRAWRGYWTVLSKVFGRRERLAAAAWPLYALDRLLVRLVRTGPSTKCALVQAGPDRPPPAA